MPYSTAPLSYRECLELARFWTKHFRLFYWITYHTCRWSHVPDPCTFDISRLGLSPDPLHVGWWLHKNTFDSDRSNITMSGFFARIPLSMITDRFLFWRRLFEYWLPVNTCNKASSIARIRTFLNDLRGQVACTPGFQVIAISEVPGFSGARLRKLTSLFCIGQSVCCTVRNQKSKHLLYKLVLYRCYTN